MDDARKIRDKRVRLQREARERFRRTDPGWAPDRRTLEPGTNPGHRPTGPA